MTKREEEAYRILNRIVDGELPEKEGIRLLEKLGVHPADAAEMIYTSQGGSDVIAVDGPVEEE